MKLLPKFAILNLLYVTAFPVIADDTTDSYTQQQMSNSMQEVVQYLQNWGQYIGYDITQSPSNTIQNFSLSQNLLSLSFTQVSQVALFYTYLGAIPVNSFNSNAFAQFVPTSMSIAALLNPYANSTFENYGSSGQSSTGVTTNSMIDQASQTSQSQPSQISDPVTQSVFNILATPDSSYCMSYDGTTWDPNCSYLTASLVSDNVIGTLPDSKSFFTSSYVQQFLSQLNANVLTSPLLYSTQSSQESGSNGGSQSSSSGGLTADNQAQQAANFIRYVSGGVSPISLPNWKQYDTLYAQAVAPSNSTTVTPVQQHQAQDLLSRYLATLRTYAAQNSVGLSNLYYILSKRLPQSPKQPLTNYVEIQNTQPVSEALSEFNMATWRIFNPASAAQGQPSQPGNTQWISHINNASTATVEKELAVLMAEMNYQLYLNRQVQERLLLTNTILLLQSLRSTSPSSDFTQLQQQLQPQQQ